MTFADDLDGEIGANWSDVSTFYLASNQIDGVDHHVMLGSLTYPQLILCVASELYLIH